MEHTEWLPCNKMVFRQRHFWRGGIHSEHVWGASICFHLLTVGKDQGQMAEDKSKLILLAKKIKNWQWARKCISVCDLGKLWKDSKRAGNVAELTKNRQ